MNKYFLGIEKVQGHPISQKVEQTVISFSFVILIVLLVFVTIQDLMRIF